MNMARAELFEPTTPDNLASTPMVIEFGEVLFKEVDKEIMDSKKATFWNMSISNSPLSYKFVMANGGNLPLGFNATNDDAESALNGATDNIQCGNCIAIKITAAVSDANRNDIYDRPIAPSKNVKKQYTTQFGSWTIPSVPRSNTGMSNCYGNRECAGN